MSKNSVPAYEGDKPYIFVSYAHKNSDEVMPIIAALNEAGYRVWYDEGIEVGAEWPAYIEDHLVGCQVVLIFISEYAVESINCRNEINLAHSLGKDMLVIYLEPTQLRRGLALQLGTVQSILKYEMESAEKLMHEIMSVSLLLPCLEGGEINVDQKAKAVSHHIGKPQDPRISPLLERVRIFLEDGAFESADQYCEKILDIDPRCAAAYFGKLCASFKVSSPEALTDTIFDTEFISASPNFKKILQFGSDEETSRANAIIENNRKNHLEADYRLVLTAMAQAKNAADFDKVISMLRALGNYKDCEQKISECKERILGIKYAAAMNAKDNATNVAGLEKAMQMFSMIISYKDSAKMHAECIETIKEINKHSSYNLAVTYIKEDTTIYLTKAIKLLEELSGFKDAEELCQKCRERIQAIEEQENRNKEEAARKAEKAAKKEAIKKKALIISSAILIIIVVILIFGFTVITPNSKYEDAMSLIEQGKYDEAIILLESIDNHKDVHDHLVTCHFKVGNYRVLVEKYGFTDIVIPEGETMIDDREFFHCDELQSITLPSSLTYIGNYAFFDCKNLKSVTIPSGVTNIGVSAFSGSGLKAVTFEEGFRMTNIPDQLFGSCMELTDIELPSSIKSIGFHAFSYCSKLTEISIPDSVTEIGDSAFYNCYKLTSLTFGDNSQLTSIGANAFAYCGDLKKVELPDSVKSINKRAFDSCHELSHIYLPEGLISIGANAFAYCSEMVKIIIPSSVETMGGLAFYQCQSLTVYCRASNTSADWDPQWNPSLRPVIWGYKGN